MTGDLKREGGSRTVLNRILKVYLPILLKENSKVGMDVKEARVELLKSSPLNAAGERREGA